MDPFDLVSCAKLDMWVHGVDVFLELTLVFYFLDDNGIIYTPSAESRGIGRCVDCPDIKVLHEKASND